MPFKLSATLQGHQDSPKAVASPSPDLILSAARDSTTIAWFRSSPLAFTPQISFQTVKQFVNAVTYLPATPEVPQGYAVSGGQDGTINIWPLDGSSKEPSHVLLGHQSNICALNTGTDSTIISGSWDGTAKVWKDFQLVYNLKGHEGAVWAVLALEDDQYLTGGADRKIILWQKNKVIRIFNGHKDAVRGLVLITDIGFASASNDTEILLWTFDGDIIHSLKAHTAYIYSLAALPCGDIVSVGEDRTARLWRDGECAQTIVHPGISVWSISAMPNGDFVTACSDGLVRVFSEHEERWASAEDLKEFEEQVANSAVPSAEVAGVDKNKLPGEEALANPGQKDGQTMMVRENGAIMAYSWDSMSRSWQKIGEVTGTDKPKAGEKVNYEGKQWDYVFDVAIEDGAPALKLPYNVSENPYTAAHRFLERNGLPMHHLDDTAQFIERNTEGFRLDAPGAVSDPFTGGSRYVASGSSVPTGPQASYSDPFTGASRYVAPSGGGTSSGASFSGGDPFTGASRYVSPSMQPPAPAPVPAQPKSIIPRTEGVSLKTANLPAMKGKIYQLNDDLAHEISTASLVLYPEEKKHIEDCFAYLTEVTDERTSRPPTRKLQGAHIETLVHVLQRWPDALRFPVIDLARLLVGYCAPLIQTSGTRDTLFNALFDASGWQSILQTPRTKSHDTNILLLLRTLANAFQEKTLFQDGVWAAKIFDTLFAAPPENLQKQQRVAFASILLNFSCISLEERVDPTLRANHLRLIDKVLRVERQESEPAYRALVALGNVLYASKTQNNPLDDALAAELMDAVLQVPGELLTEEREKVRAEVLAIFEQ